MLNHRGSYCYDAHVYFPSSSEGLASLEDFKQSWEAEFKGSKDIKFGKAQISPMGPHTMPNFKAVLTRNVYGEVVMWLQQHRPLDLSILVHPITLYEVC